VTTTTKPRQANASTPRLSEVARHLVIPDNIATSVWPRVERLLASVDVWFDPWQQGLGAVALGLDEHGTYTATVGGVVISIPRQVGKTFTVGHLLIALAIEFPGLRVVWTSHHNRTTTNTFRSMQGLLRKPKLAAHLADNGIRTANGEQEIRFRNGSIIMFGAREHGFGRGLDAIDVLVFDEAQILGLKALEDMVPATLQARNRHGGLVFLMGTPPRPGDDGEAFGALRDAAISGSITDAVFVELSADPGADPDDHKQWAKANPSFPHRTPLESMLRMRRLVPDNDSWRREALGVWDDPDAAVASSVFDLGRWDACSVPAAPVDGSLAYGVKFSPNGETVALAVAVRPEVGPIHVEGVDVRLVAEGTGWLVDWLAARSAHVAIDGRSGAGDLAAALRRAGVQQRRVHRTTTDEAIAAAAGLVNAVAEGELSHLADPALDPSVVVRRQIGNSGGWGFTGRDGEDVALFDAIALARRLVAAQPKPAAAGGRRIVMPA
jgi:hypothetical protein